MSLKRRLESLEKELIFQVKSKNNWEHAMTCDRPTPHFKLKIQAAFLLWKKPYKATEDIGEDLFCSFV